MANIDESVEDYLKSLTLLCVEDNKTTQELYKSILEDKVKRIIYSYDGQDGFHRYLDSDIDIIITDYFMPTMNGLEMSEQIREIDEKIPIILVSAIEDVKVVTKALRLNITNFIEKPLSPQELTLSIENTAKIILADKILENQKNKKIATQKAKERYTSYQENLAFSKELNILKNDFYYKMIDSNCTTLIDFFYKPLDIVSGDAYSIRKINDTITFYLIVDGMGKGLSASLSAMLMTSFINHVINKMIEAKDFDLYKLIYDSLEYIKPILLEEEALAVDFITLNCDDNIMNYAKFAMPPILLQSQDDKIIKLKSNDQPISKYIRDINISSYDTSNIKKFLFYSDGVAENIIEGKNKLYAESIEEDFSNSFSNQDMKNFILNAINTQEDDITFIFLNKINLKDSLINTKKFKSDLETIDIANEWYDDVWSSITNDAKAIYSASIVFTELFMNAYEHGNLGIKANEKHLLLEEDKYFETLSQRELLCDKKITVTIHKIINNTTIYIVTQISDEGEGFDTRSLSKIFSNESAYNGRGVFVSKKSSSGIYYNSVGNSVLFLHKLED